MTGKGFSHARSGTTPPTIGNSREVEGDGEENQEPDNEDALSEIIMAVDVKDRMTIGCCYYVAREEKLALMEDVKLGSLEMVQTCMQCSHSLAWTTVTITHRQ